MEDDAKLAVRPAHISAGKGLMSGHLQLDVVAVQKASHPTHFPITGQIHQ